MRSTFRLLVLLEIALMCIAGCSMPGKTLLQQTEIAHIKVAKAGDKVPDIILRAEPKQTVATAVRISGYVRAEGVTGVRDEGFLIVTNLTYEKTPVFWYTILYPDTGTHPWQHVEKYIEPRLPIQKIEMFLRLEDHVGEAWFRDFKVEEVPAWKENAELVVATLGDSTGVMAYMPDEETVWGRLEMLLRDRFPDRHLRVRCLAASGEWLQGLLSSGRLERELETLERCDFMIIRYGLNDSGQVTPSDFKRQLLETADRVRAKFPACRIILATTIPPGVPEYDEATRAAAKERNYILVDIAAFLTNEAKRGNGNWHTARRARIGFHADANPPDDPTGLKGNKHPNAYGGQLVAEEEYRVLEPLVAKRLSESSPR